MESDDESSEDARTYKTKKKRTLHDLHPHINRRLLPKSHNLAPRAPVPAHQCLQLHISTTPEKRKRETTRAWS
jgi:hypothetical protein